MSNSPPRSQPDDPLVRLAQLVLDYRKSVEAKDDAEAARLAAEAGALKQELPENPVPYDITIDNLVRNQDFEGALDEVDAAIALRPDDLKLYRTRLVLLEQMGDVSGVEAQLREMVEASRTSRRSARR